MILDLPPQLILPPAKPALIRDAGHLGFPQLDLGLRLPAKDVALLKSFGIHVDLINPDPFVDFERRMRKGSALVGHAPRNVLSTMTVVDTAIAFSNATGTNSVTVPTTSKKGDVMVVVDMTQQSASFSAQTTPAGCRRHWSNAQVNTYPSIIVSSKIMDGTEGGNSLSGMTVSASASLRVMWVLILRPDAPVWAVGPWWDVLTALWSTTNTSSDPASVSKTPATSTFPIFVFAHYWATGNVDPRTFTVNGAASGTEWASGDTNSYLKGFIKNKGDTSNAIAADMADEGSNQLTYCALTFNENAGKLYDYAHLIANDSSLDAAVRTDLGDRLRVAAVSGGSGGMRIGAVGARQNLSVDMIIKATYVSANVAGDVGIDYGDSNGLQVKSNSFPASPWLTGETRIQRVDAPEIPSAANNWIDWYMFGQGQVWEVYWIRVF